MDRVQHWRSVYRDKTADTVSWYQPVPAVSLELIQTLAPDRDAAIMDVGGGASLLVDCLLDAGYRRVTVLDVAPEALRTSRERLGERAEQVTWVENDVIHFQPETAYDLWHDRAAFHFLTEAEDRQAYVAVLKSALKPGGSCIIATFALDGPERCSGLPVRRYDEGALLAELGPGFRLLDCRRETHRTPAGADQSFTWCVLHRR